MSYTSLIRISLNGEKSDNYPGYEKTLIGTKKKNPHPYKKTGTHLFSVTGANESDVLDATEKLIQKLKTKPQALDYINITIAKDD